MKQDAAETLEAGAAVVEAMGNHLKHMFSCGEYWLHPGITDEYLETVIMDMAALPRGWSNPKPPKKYFKNIGHYVYCDPSSQVYQQRLVDYVDKLCDYSHDFISMDIWPLGQPRVSHNPDLPHPPGLGKWYVDANIQMLKKLHATVYAREPEAIFGGESMAEPYMPWMHATVMRSIQAPVNRGKKGRIDFIRIPLFNYIYGDQVMTWNAGPMTQVDYARMDMCLQFVRGNLIGITDKIHPQYLDPQAMGIGKDYQPGGPVGPSVLRKGFKLGGPELRKANLEFAAMLNDIQNAEFHDYFANGRGWRQPQGFIKGESENEWRKILIYDRNPAIGALRKEGSDKILWALGNGRNEQATVRLVPLKGRKIIKSTLQNEPEKVKHEKKKHLEIILEPNEIALIEWGA